MRNRDAWQLSFEALSNFLNIFWSLVMSLCFFVFVSHRFFLHRVCVFMTARAEPHAPGRTGWRARAEERATVRLVVDGLSAQRR